MTENPIPGTAGTRIDSNQNVFTLQALTFGRWRVTFAHPDYSGRPNLWSYDDGY